jgi:hypothetical protein
MPMLSKKDRDAVLEVARAVRNVKGNARYDRGTLYIGETKQRAKRASAAYQAPRIIVRVTGNTRDGTNWRWTYNFTEVIKTAAGFGGWTDKSGGLTGTGTLRNLIEDQNGTTAGGGVLGNGVDVDNLGTFEPQPIPTGTRIEIWAVSVAGATEYWCQYENGVDGAC